MEKRSQLNTEAQKRQNEIVIEQVQSYQKLKPQLEKLSELKDAMEQKKVFHMPKKKKTKKNAERSHKWNSCI